MKLLSILFILLSGFAAFARPNLPKPYVMVPVVIDQKTRAQVWVFPRGERKEFAIEAEPLFQALHGFLRPELMTRLSGKKNADGVLFLRDLDGVGLSTDFSVEELELRIAVPMKYRKSSELDLTFNEINDRRYSRPDRPSGYLNLRAIQPYQYGVPGVSDQKLPASGRLDLVQNFNGLIFESGVEMNESALYPAKRQDTHFIWDSEEKMIRTTVGDMFISPRGFQSSGSLGGVAVSREFSIQPYRTAKPLSQSELYIKRPALVEIYVDGYLYSQLRLNPGRFNIRDFPLLNGQTNIQVRVKDDLGQEEVFEFSVLYENTLLAEGYHEFGYYLGKPWTESGGDRAYDSVSTWSSFFHRYGLSDTLTLGINFQNYQSRSLYGTEGSFITPLGFVSAEGAISDHPVDGAAGAGRLRFRSLDRIFGQENKNILSLDLEKREEKFHAIGDGALYDYTTRADAQLSRRITDSVFAGVGSTYEWARALIDDRRTYRANIVFPVTRRLRFESSYSRVVMTREEDRFFISLFWSDSPGIYSVSSYYDSQNAVRNLSLSRNNLSRYDDLRFNASIQDSSISQNGHLNVDYLGQMGIVRLENDSYRNDVQKSNVATLGVSTALAWVGTELAISQPIHDSFAMIAAKDMPARQVLLINPNDIGADAQLGPRSHAVLHEMTSYYKYTVNLDSTTLPYGYLLSKEYYNVQPTYKSGILIPVQFFSRVMVKGQLILDDGSVAAFIVGDIYDEQQRLVDNNFFTNKNGQFVIEGLKPGRYSIRTDRAGTREIPFEVKAVDGNLLQLDRLILQRSQP